MSDIYTLLSELVKDSTSSQGATLELLINKGLITDEDIRKWELIKSKHLARLDQEQSAITEQFTNYIREKMETKQQAPLAKPAQPLSPFRAILRFITGV